jgi:hypothetical protein
VSWTRGAAAGRFRLGPAQLAGLSQLADASSPQRALGVLSDWLLQGANAHVLTFAIDAELARAESA